MEIYAAPDYRVDRISYNYDDTGIVIEAGGTYTPARAMEIALNIINKATPHVKVEDR